MSLDCDICQCPIYLMTKLDCGHTFCYDCVYTWTARSNETTCPMCRADFTFNPDKVELHLPDNLEVWWFYKGRNHGWWAFDPAKCEELERLYREYRHQPCPFTIFGETRIINFSQMIQSNQRRPDIRREIKRVPQEELENFKESETIKGISGIKTTI